MPAKRSMRSSRRWRPTRSRIVSCSRSQFYTTWLMRLEGRDRKEWEPEIEAARQNWRLLAEQAGDEKEAATHRSDLESAIKLSRLEIEDLQGLPLPGE